jgi:predicted kinase
MATLYFFCGKMAAGKSTLARELARRDNAILFVQDDLLDALYPGAVVSVATYVEYAGRINTMLAPHIIAILKRGVSVVVDFPGNTRPQRAWFRGLIDQAAVPHELHYLDTADEVCRAQLKSRSRHLPPGTPWTTDADFDLIASHFEAPAADEGFTLVVHERKKE